MEIYRVIPGFEKYSVSDHGNVKSTKILKPFKDNEIKNDNRASNLEWCTVKYNNRYSQKQYKLDDDKAREIRMEYSCGGVSHYKIAKKYGVSANAIMQVLKNKSYATNS